MVGATYPHKNVAEVIRMADIWRNRYRLKFVSSMGEYRWYLEKLVYDLGLQNYVSIEVFVSQEHLTDLYKACSALVYHSNWEGFGIPPLEAMRYNKPIILSDSSKNAEHVLRKDRRELVRVY